MNVTSEIFTRQSEASGRGHGSAYPHKMATATHPINELVARRWSPRAFDEARAVERHKLLALLEAARWAPSCFNEQPWRYLVFDDSDAAALERARACLIDFNAWARKAPVLILSVACERFKNGTPNRHAQHDLGLATENLVLEAVHQDLVVHQMGGFDAARARREFAIPDGHTPMAMIAIGYATAGPPDQLPASLRAMELQPRQRKRLDEIAFSGRWNAPLAR